MENFVVTMSKAYKIGLSVAEQNGQHHVALETCNSKYGSCCRSLTKVGIIVLSLCHRYDQSIGGKFAIWLHASVT
jgi:hypothetical protein